MAENKTKIITKIIILLFILNFLYLFTYFLRHPTPPSLNRHLTTLTSTPKLKPWPTLPSFLPWSHHPFPAVRSCESYFGNGFTSTLHLINKTSSSSGWFKCHYSETLWSSICEGGSVRMDQGRIRMSKGGESIGDVTGRNDEVELPVFDPGAFQIITVGDDVGGRVRVVEDDVLDKVVPNGGEIVRHTMRDLFTSMVLVRNSNHLYCSQWIEEPTLFVTRYEYANVFHTHTDWYSAYVSSRVIGLPSRPNVVFVDGHCKTQLEETWEALFSNIKFAKNFTSPVCFRHAIYVPLGYETAWFKALTQHIHCHGVPAQEVRLNPEDWKTARISEFGEMIKAAFSFPLVTHRTPKSYVEHNVLFVRREDYVAHPRHMGKVESRLSNEKEVFDSLKSWASGYTRCRVNMINGVLAHMPMKEQIRAIQDASVIIGAHGAGLTHMVSALPGTVILEIIGNKYQRPHFRLISMWKGLEYHRMFLPDNRADPPEVIKRLVRILNKTGC